jgi:choice-of-anchor A domain-containing protein
VVAKSLREGTNLPNYLVYCNSKAGCGLVEPGKGDDICPTASLWMGQYDLITLEDFSSDSDVEGTSFVGGNIISSQSANFAIHMTSLDPKLPGLEVAGSIADGSPLNVNRGSLVIGTGSITGSGPVPYKVGNRRINANAGNEGAKVRKDITLRDKAGQIERELKKWSIELNNLSAPNTYTRPTNQHGPFILNAKTKDINGVAVFWITANHLFGNDKVQQVELRNDVNAAMVVINVAGKTINWNSGNMVGAFNNKSVRGTTVWNFFEAENIDFGSKNFMGALLAPLAHVKTRGNIDGATAVRMLTINAEVHLPTLSSVCPDHAGASAQISPTVPISDSAPKQLPAASVTKAPTRAPVVPPTPAPVATPTGGNSGQCVADWQDCSKSPSCCGTSVCVFHNQWYSQCKPKPSSFSGQCVSLWGDCTSNPSCCDGSTCNYSNQWYSQCKPAASTNNSGGQCVALWGDCSKNPSCCGSSKCIYKDQWYSQCRN